MVATSGEAVLPIARERRRMLPPWALIAAALLHLLPVLIWLWHWPMASAPSPPVFKVTLVRAPPKPTVTQPPSPPAAAPRPRESGPDQTTEAKKTAKPEPAPPPRVRSATAPATDQAAAAAPKPSTEGMRVLELHLPVRGDAERNRAGDPYLNAIMQRIESNRIYPPASAFYGAPQRTVVYSVGVNPAGTVSTITLLASSGQSLVDEAARQMIAASAPFPHLPADLPQVRTSIVIFIPVYPPG
ncbi:MAG: TonB family protein [Alphaproteobacteria bacterium]|nr:TonB family protein [Alphaproteobacteria bacterium]